MIQAGCPSGDHTTQVSAALSPKRVLSRLNISTISPSGPNKNGASTSRMSQRASSWAKPAGPPPRRTTLIDMIIMPGVRPRHLQGTSTKMAKPHPK